AGWMGDKLKAAVQAGSVSMDRVNDGVTRILTPMFQMGLFDDVWKNNKGNLQVNATSVEHNTLARSIAAEGMVLLKNANGALPIDVGSQRRRNGNFTIALIGTEAAAPQVHGGGSGQVTPYYVSAPLTALKERLGIPGAASLPNNCSDGQYETNIDYYNQDSQTSAHADSVDACCKLCAARVGCNYFTWQTDAKTCWMKADNKGRQVSANRISGACHAQPAPGPSEPVCNAAGVCVTYDVGTDTAHAAETAKTADVAVVLVATNSHEGADRDSLSFGGNADDLVAAVAAANKRTVAVGVTPGAALTPWRDDVAAALVAFMPGQEYGNALVDVLLGSVNPSGKLPLSFPTKENECPAFTQDMWPGSNNAAQANYSEHMEIGYRCYDSHKIEPAFAFGHGLSYTSFSYSNLKASATSVSVDITNTGKVDG
ncbi:MAG: glycoside hydrolase family 3 C-terminal domain-containing protein, partial [Candidatus Thermoplasmatota archaeon]|nr:glycoside hydrolase family 3 C-terminal domain-containing protein [Candidatus Thermoplasmatota archaeon]